MQKDIPRKKFLETLSFVNPAKATVGLIGLLGQLWFCCSHQNHTVIFPPKPHCDFQHPPYFDFLQTQTSFEKLYQESRPYLNHQDKIERKRILFSLYSKYKSGFFFSKKQKFSNISKEELEALKNLKR